MPTEANVSRVEVEMNFGWARANPSLLVERVIQFQTDHPITDWTHRIDLSRLQMMKLIAYRRAEPYASVTDYVMDGDTYLKEVGMIEPAPATVQPEEPKLAQISIDIDWEHVANAVVGAFEGGYSPWLHSAVYQDTPPSVAALETPHYSQAAFWSDGGTMRVVYDEATDEEGEGNGHKTIGAEDMKRGFARMAAGSPGHFGDMIAENDDAITHDVFMQYVILGDVIYG